MILPVGLLIRDKESPYEISIWKALLSYAYSALSMKLKVLPAPLLAPLPVAYFTDGYVAVKSVSAACQ